MSYILLLYHVRSVSPVPTSSLDEPRPPQYRELKSEKAASRIETAKRTPSPSPQPEQPARTEAVDGPRPKRTIAEIVAPSKVSPAASSPSIEQPTGEQEVEEPKPTATAYAVGSRQDSEKAAERRARKEKGRAARMAEKEAKHKEARLQKALEISKETVCSLRWRVMRHLRHG